MIRIEANIKVISPNVKKHFYILYSKNKKMRQVVRMLLNLEKHNLPSLPVCVRFIRVAKRLFDESNFIAACKGIQDEVADFLIPGKAPGQADSSPLISWYYLQEKPIDKKEKFIVEIF